MLLNSTAADNGKESTPRTAHFVTYIVTSPLCCVYVREMLNKIIIIITKLSNFLTGETLQRKWESCVTASRTLKMSFIYLLPSYVHYHVHYLNVYLSLNL